MIKFCCSHCSWEGEVKVVCERTLDNSIGEPKGWFIEKYVICPKCGKVELVNPCLVPDIIMDLTSEEWNAKDHSLSLLYLDTMCKRL